MVDHASNLELRALYHELTNRCDPNKAKIPGEKDLRAALMLRLNLALSAGNVEQMRRLAIEIEEKVDPAWVTPPPKTHQ